MNNKLKNMWKCLWPSLEHYHDIYVEGLRRTVKTLSHGQFPDQDLNHALPY